jgi:tRNA(fMet)-specific endonuclease VapC
VLESPARLDAAGKTAPFIDGQIAAIAAVEDLLLVSCNKAAYRGFSGLRIETW